VDFYEEGLLIWLEADVLIRQKSGGARSLDDFCRLFTAGTSGRPEVVPHTFEDVVQTLNRVAPYDWRGFLTSRIDSVTSRAPLGGIEAAGWRLAYVDTASGAIKASEKVSEYVDESFSLGITLDKDGMITDVWPESPAAKAGMGPHMKLIAVDGRRYKADRLREQLRARRNAATPLELLAEQGDFVRTFQVDWPGSPAYPALARDPSRPDLLSEILKPRTSSVPPQSQ
jgi:predicted metalloprotease with PDZ domain